MIGRKRRIVMAGTAALMLLAMAAQHPRANIEILTHQAGDLSPQKLQAVIDTGVFAVSVLVTWSRHFAQ
ncbi:hypothetical protein IAG41_21045 [Sphingomonas sp. JC676]|uniref:hypothetical protein n=1 Tax=Sphingomonas sp. JC676 TaxID=2768065 RepID=UPI001657AF8E|nr:hypothetical protein [Sphingomonas sp. JC676]MBC9034886.1 hypothetical protein [Sphingomonas sp. JC676]